MFFSVATKKSREWNILPSRPRSVALPRLNHQVVHHSSGRHGHKRSVWKTCLCVSVWYVSQRELPHYVTVNIPTERPLLATPRYHSRLPAVLINCLTSHLPHPVSGFSKAPDPCERVFKPHGFEKRFRLCSDCRRSSAVSSPDTVDLGAGPGTIFTSIAMVSTG